MFMTDLSKDSIELLIIKHNKGQSDEIERIYVKKSDVNEIVRTAVSKDTYVQAMKWTITTILVTFGAGAILFLFQNIKF